MFCARCETELERFSRPVDGGLRFVEAGMCFDCGGLWIPASGIPIAFPELLPAVEAAPREGTRVDAACPDCRTGLYLFVIEDLSLDACGTCAGLWVDGDEILAVEGAREAIARHGDRTFGGSYRSQARRLAEVATTLCAGCSRPLREGAGKPSPDGPLCPVCADAIANPIEPPVGLAGRVRRALRRLFQTPCEECGEYVCAHRPAPA